MNEKEDLVWEEWSLLVLNYIPSQKTEECSLDGNCGLFICSSALCIATCSNVNFDESDMQSNADGYCKYH